MKSLSLAKPLVLVMVGHPGAGKSFFARQFSQTFGAPIVSANRIRHELYPEPTYGTEEQNLVQNIANYQIEELLKTGRTFIVDGNMNPRVNRQKLQAECKAAGYGTLVVWVQTDLPTCKQRSLKRNKQKIDDQYTPSLSQEQFDSFTKHMTPPNHLEQAVVISGKHTYNTQAHTVLKKLVAPREEAAERQNQQHPPRPQQPPQPPRRRLNVSMSP